MCFSVQGHLVGINKDELPALRAACPGANGDGLQLVTDAAEVTRIFLRSPQTQKSNSHTCKADASTACGMPWCRSRRPAAGAECSAGGSAVDLSDGVHEAS